MVDVKKQLQWSRLKVGGVITLALVILLIAIFFAGAIEDLFSPMVKLKVQFRDVKGLRRGSPVWINGTEVGSVKEIRLDPAYGTVVDIAVQKGVLGFVKKDSQASILTMGLLGDKYVELGTGSPQAEPILPNETIRGTAQTEITDIAQTSGVAIERMSEFINRLDRLVSTFESGQGTVAKFLNDPTVYDNLKNATAALSKTAENFQTSRGTLKLLLEDPSIHNRMLAAASSIEEFGNRLNKGNGTLQKLVRDAAVYDKLAAATSELEAFTKKLRDEKGTLQKLVGDSELYDNLNRGSKSLVSILSSVDQGQGMAGALVRDDNLARELKEALIKVKGLAAEMDGLTAELKGLTKDIKSNPRKYFKFSIF